MTFSKRIVKQDEDQWIVVKDMFPPLISEELWKDAHDRLNSRKRESKSGFVNIFAGLLKCDKCGYAVCISNAKGCANYFICNTYSKKGSSYCTSHYTLYDELYAAVLADIRQVLSCVLYNKEEFVRTVLEKIGNRDVSETKRLEVKIRLLENKIAELERKFDRLYDDRLEGILSDKKFKELSAKCEAEQTLCRRSKCTINLLVQYEFSLFFSSGHRFNVLPRYIAAISSQEEPQSLGQ